ncbi:MAG: helix-turn-helix transcriptional regulator [Symploca sp. SIO2G7]|nr:helix-turn-helix transcriptional regulator [Symploca sp. SIO2G7]
MQIRFSAKNVDELLTEWSQQTGSSLCIDPFEVILKMPPAMGNGWMRQIKLRPGLEMTLKHFEFSEPFVAEVTSNFSWEAVEFTSSVSGYVRNVVNGIPNEYKITPRQSRMSFFQNCGGYVECLPKQSVIHIEIQIKLPVLDNMIAGQVEQISPNLLAVLLGKSKDSFSQAQTMTGKIAQVTEQILNCPYQKGLTRRLYLESRAIELIALQLPINSPDTLPAPRLLKADEVDRIHHAKEILLTNLEHPPSLLELAKQVGLNDYKLKQGFRQVFGTTAFGCLYHHRMEQAKLLLEAGYSTVTEVAQAVGYTSPTSFSAAFKKKFGVSPKTYKC